METGILSALKDGGASVAIIVTVIIFIRYISKRDEVIETHMKNEIQTFTEMKDTFTKGNETNKEMLEYFKKLNGNLKQ